MTDVTKTENFNNFCVSIRNLINESREKSFRAVNREIITLYLSIGMLLFEKQQTLGWGKSVVEILANSLRQEFLENKGFSARNLWRMKQFYETYKDIPKLSALLTDISWSNHLHIISKTKTVEEKEFYINLASKNNYSERNFARIIDSATYERTMLADQKLPAPLAEFPKYTKGIFKDLYLFEFTKLEEGHKENDLRKALLNHMKNFLLEMGPDFSLLGEEYVVQVGMKDFRIDILLHHRGLNALVALELKISEFQPEYLGKLQFYLEALDRDVKKEHENPSIGILICKTKDDEVVNYALSRTSSPTLIAEYETKLVDKKLLQKKLLEISNFLDSQ